MTRGRRESVLWPAALIAAVLILPSVPAAAQTVLRARLSSDILSSEPGAHRDENTDTVLMHVVEGLVAYREDTSVGPMLAKSWDISDEGRRYTFHLREGVHFHNGELLTAADVLWSLHRYLEPATHWRCAQEFNGNGSAHIVSVEAADPATVVLTLDRASPMLLQTLARIDCGETAILHRDSVNRDGSWRLPVGTGPFRFAAWNRNQYIELTRFDGYAALPGARDGLTGGKRAEVGTVRFLVIPDAETAEAALVRGNLDVLDELLPGQMVELQHSPGVRVEIQPSMAVYALLFETRDPLLRDQRLRQAIALTLDVRGLVKVITRATGEANRAIVPAASPYYDARQSGFGGPNLAEARRLAAAAGYRGQPIRLIANHRYPDMFDCAVLIQAMALQAGINMEIETLDWGAQLDRYNRGDFQAMVFSYSARLDPALSFDAVIGDKSKDPRKIWDDPGAMALLQQAKSIADQEPRAAAFDHLQALFMEQVPAVVLFNPPQIVALRSNVTGFSGWPAAEQRLWNVRVQ